MPIVRFESINENCIWGLATGPSDDAVGPLCRSTLLMMFQRVDKKAAIKGERLAKRAEFCGGPYSQFAQPLNMNSVVVNKCDFRQLVDVRGHGTLFAAYASQADCENESFADHDCGLSLEVPLAS